MDEIIADRCDDQWALDQLKFQIFALAHDHGTGDERVQARWFAITVFLHDLQKIHARYTYGEDPDDEMNSFSAEWTIRGSLDGALERANSGYLNFLLGSYFNAGIVLGDDAVCTNDVGPTGDAAH